mgnify:CR=1 FL=1
MKEIQKEIDQIKNDLITIFEQIDSMKQNQINLNYKVTKKGNNQKRNELLNDVFGSIV